MITQEIIQTLTRKYQTDEINIWREYFQHLFLSCFYRQENTDKIYFKGGTAIRLIYQSPRFSEDLDFSSSLSDIKKIENAMLSALSEIEQYGITTNLQEAKETSGGYLVIIHFKNNGRVITTQLEISLRNTIKRGEITTIVSDFFPPYTLVQLSQEQLITEKINALLFRKKPRDFYDFYFLLRANLIQPKQKVFLPKILQAYQSTDKQAGQELKRFLPKSHWSLLKDFSSVFEREIKRFL